jgi:hypothetical protein
MAPSPTRKQYHSVVRLLRRCSAGDAITSDFDEQRWIDQSTGVLDLIKTARTRGGLYHEYMVLQVGLEIEILALGRREKCGEPQRYSDSEEGSPQTRSSIVDQPTK